MPPASRPRSFPLSPGRRRLRAALAAGGQRRAQRGVQAFLEAAAFPHGVPECQPCQPCQVPGGRLSGCSRLHFCGQRLCRRNLGTVSRFLCPGEQRAPGAALSCTWRRPEYIASWPVVSCCKMRMSSHVPLPQRRSLTQRVTVHPVSDHWGGD